MAMRDTVRGAMKQVKGKANDVMGAAKGDTSQQIKGKVRRRPAKCRGKLGRPTPARAAMRAAIRPGLTETKKIRGLRCATPRRSAGREASAAQPRFSLIFFDSYP